MKHHEIGFYKRKNGEYAWRFRANNGKIVATDGNQGYASEGKVIRAIKKFLSYFEPKDVIEVVNDATDEIYFTYTPQKTCGKD